MKEMGIKAQWVKPWTITTIDSDFSNELQNILDEQFTPDRPNAVWCSDITYIWTTDGFVYLTSIMDLFSRKIIAWTLSRTLEVSCVINHLLAREFQRETALFFVWAVYLLALHLLCPALAEMKMKRGSDRQVLDAISKTVAVQQISLLSGSQPARRRIQFCQLSLLDVNLPRRLG